MRGLTINQQNHIFECLLKNGLPKHRIIEYNILGSGKFCLITNLIIPDSVQLKN